MADGLALLQLSVEAVEAEKSRALILTSTNAASQLDWTEVSVPLGFPPIAGSACARSGRISHAVPVQRLCRGEAHEPTRSMLATTVWSQTFLKLGMW